MDIVERVRAGCAILAPLTKGGNLPFRRLCAEVYGAEVTVSEMAYARYIVKGESRERALLRKHPSEKCFGVQLAALQVDEALQAAQVACDMGADFIDINCGCPIDDVVRRGLGSALLRRPKALFRLVEHLASRLPIPVTVKIRTGFKESEENALEIARGVEQAGARVLTIHGRTREQRYSRAANWELIGAIASEIGIPVVGNGDILTCYEAEDRLARSGLKSVMIGRGALIKPWLFQELREGKTREMSLTDRVEVLMRLTQFMKEHFGDDELGHRRIMKFLPWHFELFSRYEYFPEDQFLDRSREHPLMQSRSESTFQSSDPLDALLRNTTVDAHNEMARRLLSADSVAVAIDSLRDQAQQPLSPPVSMRTRDEFREMAG